MAKKKITAEKLMQYAEQYKAETGAVIVKIPDLATFIQSKGHPEVKAYLIRRDEEFRKYLDNINSTAEAEVLHSFAAFKTFDANDFFARNKTRKKQIEVLSQRDKYYAEITTSATKVFNENRKLKEKIETIEKENTSLKAQLADKEAKLESKEIKDMQRRIKTLEIILNRTVGNDIAASILFQQGYTSSGGKLVSDDKISEMLIESNTDIQKYSSGLIQSIADSLFKGDTNNGKK